MASRAHSATTSHSSRAIRIRGARVHNLQSVDVDIPRDALTVITGVSGSGKSSLAFDTLFAEGQRQYIDSLSAYARQFLDSLPRPDVDLIDGLAPTMAIDQKPGSTGARSTVATITEIYDYLRLLFARVGIPHCGNCGAAVERQSPDAICQSLLKLPEGTRVVLLAPMVRGRKGQHREVFEAIASAGLVRARVDGEMLPLEDVGELSLRKNHTIEAIVDRLVMREGIESRVAESVALALQLGQGLLVASSQQGNSGWTDRLFSTAMSCVQCGSSIEEIEPRTFSFNSPYGACSTCDGLGRMKDDESDQPCAACGGTRLRPEALAVTVADASIDQVTGMSMQQAEEWINQLGPTLTELQQAVARTIKLEVSQRLNFLQRVGVQYLTLNRAAETLSGGELQRVRLATSIGSGLVGVCYVLDEPSIGLHPADHDRLIQALRDLQQQGNTVVVVEHDEATMRAADRLIDVGPGAGTQGGKIIVAGTPKQVQANKRSLTGQYLAGNDQPVVPQSRRTRSSELVLSGVRTHNLKNVKVRLPLGCLIGISGVSGSGKSSLIGDTLLPAVRYQLEHGKKMPASASSVTKFSRISGVDQLDKLVPIDQAPIGRTPRSCPATYSGVMDEIRKVFSKTREAKTRGFGANRFSFNAAAGRCDLCKGLGAEKVEMNFLSDLFVTCTRCGGKRFNRQTLQVRFKGSSIADVLAMTVNQACEFFENVPSVFRLLSSLRAVGLGYMHLGQSSTTLSGGEAQRIKLGTELARKATGQTLYVLDEPTTGLHFSDVKRLVGVLQQLVDQGNTVIVIEHDLDLLVGCDWLIDLGPVGGKDGGQLMAEGTPEQLAALKGNVTGRYLQDKLNR